MAICEAACARDSSYGFVEPRARDTPRPVSSRRSAIWLAAALALAFSGDAARAQSRSSTNPLGLALDADPLDLARAVARAGDALVLSRLARGSVAQKLAAVRAAPFLAAPEAALGALAALAAGRDPDLAPEAARAALSIARALTLEDLGRREAELSELAPARDALRRLAADASARPDVRRAASVAAGALAALAFDLPR